MLYWRPLDKKNLIYLFSIKLETGEIVFFIKKEKLQVNIRKQLPLSVYSCPDWAIFV